MHERSILTVQTPVPPIRVVFLDIDGTIAHDRRAIHPEVRDEIARIRSKGVSVALATGRSAFSADWVVEFLDIQSPSLFFSGALVKNPRSGEILEQHTLEPESTSSLVRDLVRAGIHVEAYTSSEYVTAADSALTRIHAEYAGAMPRLGDPLDPVQAGNALKLVAMVETGTIEDDEAKKIFSSHPEFKVAVSTGHAHPHIKFLNVTSPDADRSKVFLTLCSHFHVTPNEVASFGDAEADLPFMTSARYGVAMANAPQQVRQRAPYVTDSVDELGVVKALKVLVP